MSGTWIGLAAALTFAALGISAAGAGGAGADLHHARIPQSIRIVRVRTGEGFRWRDAAIGGATVLALTMIVTGGALALRHRNEALRGHSKSLDQRRS